MSRVRVSIRPSIFLYAKNIKTIANRRRPRDASGQLNRTSDAGNSGHGSSLPTSRNANELSGDNIDPTVVTVDRQRAVGTATM